MNAGVYESELVLVSAPDEAALVAAVRRLIVFLEQAPDAPLKDVAYTCARGYAALLESSPEGSAPPTLAVVASSSADLRGRLSLAV